MAEINPYRAPTASSPAEPSSPSAQGFDRRRAWVVDAGWVLVASTFGGAGRAALIGRSLEDFGSHHATAAVLGSAAWGGGVGAQIAATAAVLGTLAGLGTHALAGRGALLLRAWSLFVAIPALAVVSSTLVTATGVAIAALLFDVSATQSWAELLVWTVPSDLWIGAIKSGCFGLVAALVVLWSAARFDGVASPRWAQIVIAFIVARLALAAVGAGFDAFVMQPSGGPYSLFEAQSALQPPP